MPIYIHRTSSIRETLEVHVCHFEKCATAFLKLVMDVITALITLGWDSLAMTMTKTLIAKAMSICLGWFHSICSCFS